MGTTAGNSRTEASFDKKWSWTQAEFQDEWLTARHVVAIVCPALPCHNPISPHFNLAQEYCRKHCSAQPRVKEVCGPLAEDPAKVRFCHSQCVEIYVA